MQKTLTINEIKKKVEHFCAYQERCHDDVVSKLRDLGATAVEIDETIVHLIAQGFLNETRFAQAFARGKHRIKSWGKVRIVNELQARHISTYNITLALKEITPEEYNDTFERLAHRHWESISETNALKKRKKFCDFLVRKGYETNLVYAKAKELS